MDPVSQGIVGAVFAQSASRRSDLAKAAIIGALAGIAADIDVLIRSASDPLLTLEYHRQITHSIFFIPIGALLCSILLHPLLGKRWCLHYRQTLLWCLLSFASHGLLDTCTSYGTRLLWPFSEQRFSWDIIAVVDPLFTLPLIILVCCAALHKKQVYLVTALLWGTLYLSLGYLQHQRVENIAYQLAKQRDHQVLRMEVKPSFANLIVWKSIYQTATEFHVDGIKPGVTESSTWSAGSKQILNLERDLPWLDQQSQQAKDIERFRILSEGFLSLSSNKQPLSIADIRYSLLPNEIAPLWGIQLSQTAHTDDHVLFYTQRGDTQTALKRLLAMIRE